VLAGSGVVMDSVRGARRFEPGRAEEEHVVMTVEAVVCRGVVFDSFGRSGWAIDVLYEIVLVAISLELQELGGFPRMRQSSGLNEFERASRDHALDCAIVFGCDACDLILAWRMCDCCG
jgi:hypothetical protein